MAYTLVPKPTGRNYTNPNQQGKEQYDQTSVVYDDTNTFYDGVNTTQYTKLAKPSTSAYTKIAKPT